MDQVALRNADLLILTALTQTPTANPDSMLGEFCMAVGMQVANFEFIGTLTILPFILQHPLYELEALASSLVTHLVFFTICLNASRFIWIILV